MIHPAQRLPKYNLLLAAIRRNISDENDGELLDAMVSRCYVCTSTIYILRHFKCQAKVDAPLESTAVFVTKLQMSSKIQSCTQYSPIIHITCNCCSSNFDRPLRQPHTEMLLNRTRIFSEEEKNKTFSKFLCLCVCSVQSLPICDMLFTFQMHSVDHFVLSVNSYMTQRQENERLKGIMARIDSYDVVVNTNYNCSCLWCSSNFQFMINPLPRNPHSLNSFLENETGIK